MGVNKFKRPLLVTGTEIPDGSGGGAVESVNGKTGVVTLAAEDVGVDLSTSATVDTVPLRKSDGRVETGTASDGADAVNLTQMNGEITNLTNYINAGDSALQSLIDALTTRVQALENA